MNAGELRQLLDDEYGDHLPVVVVLPDGTHIEDFELVPARTAEGMAAVGIELAE